jgi:hypothetical protein
VAAAQAAREVLTQCRPRLTPTFRPRIATVRRLMTDGLSEASYRVTRDGRAIDYALSACAVPAGPARPGASRGSVMQMVVPSPGAETSVIMPPSCCVTRVLTM